MFLQTHTRALAHTRTYTLTNTLSFLHTYIHTHIHTHTHTHTHKHTSNVVKQVHGAMKKMPYLFVRYCTIRSGIFYHGVCNGVKYKDARARFGTFLSHKQF